MTQPGPSYATYKTAFERIAEVAGSAYTIGEIGALAWHAATQADQHQQPGAINGVVKLARVGAEQRRRRLEAA